MEATAEEREEVATAIRQRLAIEAIGTQSKEVTAKIKELESKHDCTVYAVTHELMLFGECYSFLIVPKYPEDWERIVIPCHGGHHVYAYVWNKDAPMCSEFGFIDVIIVSGQAVRIA